MDRRGRVNHDRAEMARKALRKAGYLSDEQASAMTEASSEEGKQSIKPTTQKLFEEVAAGFIADLFHIAASLGIPIAKPDNAKAETSLQGSLIKKATEAYWDDAKSSPFGES